MAQATGKVPPELQLPERPAGTDAIWQAFTDLRGAASPGPMGPGPITFRDVAAWQQVNRITLTPWEVDTIMDLDRTALAELLGDSK